MRFKPPISPPAAFYGEAGTLLKSVSKDGARLITDSPTAHRCPVCGTVYHGDPYDAVVFGDAAHSNWSQTIRNLGLAYPGLFINCRVRGANTKGNGGLRTEPASGERFSLFETSFAQRTIETGLPCSTHPTMNNPGYRFSGRKRYAQKAGEILLAYADRYATYPLHDKDGKQKVGGGHISARFLDFCNTWKSLHPRAGSS